MACGGARRGKMCEKRKMRERLASVRETEQCKRLKEIARCRHLRLMTKCLRPRKFRLLEGRDVETWKNFACFGAHSSRLALQ
jgi:hypothetical protein